MKKNSGNGLVLALGASILGATYWLTRKTGVPPIGVADIVLSALSVPGNAIIVGETALISVLATNQGNATGSLEVQLSGDFSGVHTVTLAPGASETVTWTVTPTSPGSYSIVVGTLTATLVVTSGAVGLALSNMRLDKTSYLIGEPVNLMVDVSNSGDTVGTATAALTGSWLDEQVVSVPAGQTVTATFTTTATTEGNWPVGCSLDGVSSGLSVTIVVTSGSGTGIVLSNMRLDKSSYAIGETINLMVDAHNYDSVDAVASVQLTGADGGVGNWNASQYPTVAAGATITVTFSTTAGAVGDYPVYLSSHDVPTGLSVVIHVV